MKLQKHSSSNSLFPSRLKNEVGKVGYAIAWLLGVPAWLLLMVFLIRGN